MSSVVHFQFRNALLSDSVSFEGDHVSLRDLKLLIAKKKGLLKASDIDFVITNKQTGEEYTGDDTFVPKNTSVLVKRVNAKAQPQALKDNSKPPTVAPVISTTAPPKFSSQNAGSSNEEKKPVEESTEDEEAKLIAMMEEQNAEFQRCYEAFCEMVDSFCPKSPTSKTTNATTWSCSIQIWYASFFEISLRKVTVKSGQPTAAKPPPYYLCDRCKQAGHWKKDCPTIGDPAYDQKKTAVGIPISRTRVITEAEAANATEGVMRLPDGRLVQCMPNEFVGYTDRFFIGRADFDKAIAKGTSSIVVPKDGSIPKDLQCAMMPGALILEAVVLPCCQSNVSLPRVLPHLQDNSTCPICFQPDVTPEILKPNTKLRESVKAFLKAAIAQGITITGGQASGSKAESEPDANMVDTASGNKSPFLLDAENRDEAKELHSQASGHSPSLVDDGADELAALNANSHDNEQSEDKIDYDDVIKMEPTSSELTGDDTAHDNKGTGKDAPEDDSKPDLERKEAGKNDSNEASSSKQELDPSGNNSQEMVGGHPHMMQGGRIMPPAGFVPGMLRQGYPDAGRSRNNAPPPMMAPPMGAFPVAPHGFMDMMRMMGGRGWGMAHAGPNGMPMLPQMMPGMPMAWPMGNFPSWGRPGSRSPSRSRSRSLSRSRSRSRSAGRRNREDRNRSTRERSRSKGRSDRRSYSKRRDEEGKSRRDEEGKSRRDEEGKSRRHDDGRSRRDEEQKNRKAGSQGRQGSQSSRRAAEDAEKKGSREVNSSEDKGEGKRRSEKDNREKIDSEQSNAQGESEAKQEVSAEAGTEYQFDKNDEFESLFLPDDDEVAEDAGNNENDNPDAAPTERSGERRKNSLTDRERERENRKDDSR
eukprot:763953-Hanusia_phi.AAC.2